VNAAHGKRMANDTSSEARALDFAANEPRSRVRIHTSSALFERAIQAARALLRACAMRRTTIALSCIATAGAAATFGVIDSCEQGREPSSVHTRVRHQHRSRGIFSRSGPLFFYEAPIDGGIWTDDEDTESDVYDAAVEEPPAHPMLERELCAPLAQMLCERRARCGCEIAVDCEERELDRCKSWLWCRYPEGELPGFVIHRPRLERCLAQRRAQHCGGIDSTTCEALLVDPAIEGERCIDGDGYECAGGLCIDGTCVGYSGLGEPCGEGCEEGYCDEDGFCRNGCNDFSYCPVNQVCRHGRCVPGGSVGEPCDFEARGERDCAIGLICDETSRCVRRERCETLDECAPVDVCVGASSRVCDPIGEWPLRALGAPCAVHAECESGLLCDGRCRAAPGHGELCPLRICGEGLACLGGYAEARCIPAVLAAQGERCNYAVLCERGTYCGHEGTCVRMPSLGEPCLDRCAHGLWCVEHIARGVCRPLICDTDIDPSWMCDVD
jgi:hypothetical protein